MIPPLVNCVVTDTVVIVKAKHPEDVASVRQHYAATTAKLAAGRRPMSCGRPG